MQASNVTEPNTSTWEKNDCQGAVPFCFVAFHLSVAYQTDAAIILTPKKEYGEVKRVLFKLTCYNFIPLVLYVWLTFCLQYAITKLT